MQMHSQLRSARHDGVEDIVSIPDPGDGEPVQTTVVLLPDEPHSLGVMFQENEARWWHREQDDAKECSDFMRVWITLTWNSTAVLTVALPDFTHSPYMCSYSGP